MINLSQDFAKKSLHLEFCSNIVNETGSKANLKEGKKRNTASNILSALKNKGLSALVDEGSSVVASYAKTVYGVSVLFCAVAYVV